MKTNPYDSIRELRREAVALLLEYAKNPLTELDSLESPLSRAAESALAVHKRVGQIDQEIWNQMMAASLAEKAAASASAATAEPDVAPHSTRWAQCEPKITLESRTEQIDPRTALCWNGAYAEEFGDQIQCSLALVWAPPDFADSVPDWAMRIIWAEFADEWDDLLHAAWERRKIQQRHQGRELASAGAPHSTAKET